MNKRWTAAIVAALVAFGVWSAKALAERQSATVVSPADVDRIFARYNASTPGCAVGVSSAGTPVLTKGYGSADLEHDVPITPETIFEAGSVSKQFTATAVLLL